MGQGRGAQGRFGSQPIAGDEPRREAQSTRNRQALQDELNRLPLFNVGLHIDATFMNPVTTARQSIRNENYESPLALLKGQRSHVLFVLSNARAGREVPFLDWYQGAYRKAVLRVTGALNLQQYEQHELDITLGENERLPFRYLALCEVCVDGAQAAEGLIERVATLHRQQVAAEAPATWLYYPVSEKVGRSPAEPPSMLTLAFANPVPGQEAEFREWYATRHIRHALNIPALVSGQCFARTLFQRPGALEARFDTIAVYEQEGTAESIVESFKSLPQSTFHFPMLDLDRVRFAESVYRPVQGERADLNEFNRERS